MLSFSSLQKYVQYEKSAYKKKKKKLVSETLKKIHLMVIHVYCTCAQEDLLKSINTLKTAIIKNDIDDISNIK